MESASKTFKLGTRRSLLAWAQSSWVARQIEKLNPGISVELVGIDTQGDKILDKPLSQIEGKEFFTAELDHALLDGRVDFTVHSMKDLSLDRPSKIKLAAVPARELQHDIILFHESVVDRIKNGLPVRIGTSSPRRLTLIPSFLKKALPRFSAQKEPVLEFIQIRGNVNTRLSRVHEADGTERKLDGVVLAFAGLERLAIDEKASQELWKLLNHTKAMVLPVRECPTAPAQGALAIEGHLDRDDVLSALKKLHHAETLSGVHEERKILEEWGGGCHQKLGANFIANPYGGKLFIRGEKPNGENVTEIRNLGRVPYSMSEFTKVEAAELFNFEKRTLTAEDQKTYQESEVCFIAHSRALEFLSLENSQLLRSKRVWVSGMKSWHKLAQQGIWVEGSVEYQGYDRFKAFREKALLRMKLKTAFLTHAESSISDDETALIATYSHRFKEIPQKILNATHLYWSSGLPFSTVWSMLGSSEKQAEFAKKVHASGAGKTAAALRSCGIEPVVIDAD